MARQSGATSAPKPKKVRWYHQVWQAYQLSREQDPAITWWILLAFVGPIVLAQLVGAVSGWASWLYWLLLGVPFGALAGLLVLSRRAERAAYIRIKGQPGAARAALGTIRRGWTFPEEPVAVDPRTQDMVFRGVGRAGVLLIGDGPAPRVTRLVEQERRRTARVLSGVPIIVMEVGDGEGQVPLDKLARRVQRLRPKLTKAEVAVVLKRLNAMGTLRLPVPKGLDPLKARPDRKGMRGR